MKKATPWAEDIENAIAKARLEFRKVEKALAEALAAAVGVLLRGDEPPPKDDQPTPKRRAVTAQKEEIEFAYEILCRTKPPFSFLSAENVSAIWDSTGGKRIAGAALKALVADGRAVVKRGKYAQSQPAAQTADGATSEAP